ncbi:MAG TPA: hypothetical protein VN704_00175, partial [Verrucomicrobiae bacterium]|nr:hypothetical protein [Verrucomicrobiae bacterium]
IRNTVKNITYLQQLQWNFYCFRFYFINKTLVKNEKNNHATKQLMLSKPIWNNESVKKEDRT